MQQQVEKKFICHLGVEEQAKFILASPANSSAKSKLARQKKMLTERVHILELQLAQQKEELAKESAATKALTKELAKESAATKALTKELAKESAAREALSKDLLEKLAKESAAREAACLLLETHIVDLEQKTEQQNNCLVATISLLTDKVKDLEPLRPVGLRKFCEIARWKVYSFLVKQGCQEPWMDKGWNYMGWNNMVLGIGQNPYWLQLLLAEGVSLDALHLLRYGIGSLQNQGSEAAHAGPEKDCNLEVAAAQCRIKAYAKCISVQKLDDRALLNSLFEFCFAAGGYLRFT